MAKKKYTGADIVNAVLDAKKQAQQASGRDFVSNADLSKAVSQNLSGNQNAQEFVSSTRERHAEIVNAYNDMVEQGRYWGYAHETPAAKVRERAAIDRYRKKYPISDADLIKGYQQIAAMRAAGTAGNLKRQREAAEAQYRKKLQDAEKQAARYGTTAGEPVTAENVAQDDGWAATYVGQARREQQNAELAVQLAENRLESGNASTIAAYEKAMKQYLRATEAEVNAEAKYIVASAPLEQQRAYVKDHASEEQGKKLRQEYDKLSRAASMDRDTSTWHPEEEQKQIDREAADARKKLANLQHLIRINDYYADRSNLIRDMEEQEFTETYQSYMQYKTGAEALRQQAAELRKEADPYLRTNPGLYQTKEARAEELERKAADMQEKADAITGGDAGAVHIMEQRGAAAQLSKTAHADQNFKKYAHLGEGRNGGRSCGSGWRNILRMYSSADWSWQKRWRGWIQALFPGLSW